MRPPIAVLILALVVNFAEAKPRTRPQNRAARPPRPPIASIRRALDYLKSTQKPDGCLGIGRVR